MKGNIFDVGKDIFIHEKTSVTSSAFQEGQPVPFGSIEVVRPSARGGNFDQIILQKETKWILELGLGATNPQV